MFSSIRSSQCCRRRTRSNIPTDSSSRPCTRAASRSSSSGPVWLPSGRCKGCGTPSSPWQGNNMIIDDVVLGSVRAHYGDLAAAHHVSFVGVFAPLDVLEARERQRGDRLIGLARWQYERVHKDEIYDLEIDASRATPLECATIIKQRFQL